MSSISPALSVADVARTLGVSVRHVQKLVAEGRVPHVRLGRSIRFPSGALEQWLNDQAQESIRTAPPAAPQPAVRRRRRTVPPVPSAAAL